jgi:cytidylate kinase
MSRKCTVCRSPDRHHINVALTACVPYRDIARHYRLSKDAVARHRCNHLNQDEDVDPKLAAVVAEVKTVNAGYVQAMALLDDAWRAETWNAAMLKVRQARVLLKQVLTPDLR